MSKSIGKRAAKRLAYFHIALTIENSLEGGWESLDRYGDDRHLVEAALMDIVQQFFEESRDPAAAPSASVAPSTPPGSTETRADGDSVQG